VFNSIRPEDWHVAESVHERFVSRPGSQYIASIFALANLAALLRRHQPSSVVEFGAGIGTITYLLLTYGAEDRVVVSTEHHPYCLEQLKRNIPAALWKRLTVISDGSEPRGEFDLAIIDGPIPESDQGTILRPGLICFVEGGRDKGQALIQERARQQALVCSFKRYRERRQPFRLKYRFRIKWSPTRFGFARPIPRLSLALSMRGFLGSGCAIATVTRKWRWLPTAGGTTHRV
jgi:protein-L-isoaspartate O-methyltransferase